MSQKTSIEEMLAAGKGYDEIEDSTGSTRSYIRSVAVSYRNREGEPENEVPKKKEEPTETQPKDEGKPSMTFVNDDPEEKEDKTDAKGTQSHKEWVKAAKYECGGCGATIGRTQDFCAHCGKTLAWKGIE